MLSVNVYNHFTHRALLSSHVCFQKVWYPVTFAILSLDLSITNKYETVLSNAYKLHGQDLSVWLNSRRFIFSFVHE